MRLDRKKCCDVLVVGAGLAGISAAISAAETGASVILISSSTIFSGSSFYPGTWGLGLIGPENESDCNDLMSTIKEVGCGMASPDMVSTFVRNISPAIENLSNMGVKLRRPTDNKEKGFIPCFDHKHRDWYGLEYESGINAFGRKLEELNIEQMPHCKVIELVQHEGKVCGAVVAQGAELSYIGANAVVWAGGGFGGLFKYRLNTNDVTGMGQALALQVGCSLVNVEFMQMMPGYVSPSYSTVFNEKAFIYTEIEGQSFSKEILAERSGYGPFTTRLPSCAVDIALFERFVADERGVKISYHESIKNNTPEIIKNYFVWLKEKKSLGMDDPINVGVFAHASNGGIKINPDCSTGVDGFFACGECTGGMHGADRIGGLSTANGLVFGRIAGRSSVNCETASVPEYCNFDGYSVVNTAETLSALREIMFRSAMIERSEENSSKALALIGKMQEKMRANRHSDENVVAIATTRELEGQLQTATAILRAISLRRESRGSHHRKDFEYKNESMAKQIIISGGDEITAKFRD